MRLYPLAGQPLGLGNLFAHHLLLDNNLVALRNFVLFANDTGYRTCRR